MKSDILRAGLVFCLLSTFGSPAQSQPSPAVMSAAQPAIASASTAEPAIPVIATTEIVTTTGVEAHSPTITLTSVGSQVRATDLLSIRDRLSGCLNAAGKPTKLDDLTGGYKVFYSRYTESGALSLGLISAGTLEGKKRSEVQVYSFLQFIDVPCVIGDQTLSVTWGAGADAVLHVKSAKAGFNLTKLSAVAAAVEFGKARVEFSMRTRGVTGTQIKDALPDAGEFNVENYGKLITAIDKVRRLMGQTGVTVVPAMLIESNELNKLPQSAQTRPR